MSRPTYLECRQIMDAGGIVVRICPATSGLPTRMSEAGWQALCKSTRQREQAAPSGDGYGSNAASVIRRRLNYCAICKGKIRPKGLEIIPAAELAAMKSQHLEEASMAKASGKCTTCGRGVAALSSCHGEKLCPSCSAVYSAINNRPKVVLDGMRKLKPELLEEFAGSPAVQVSVESEALKRIAEAVGYAGEDGEVLVQAVSDMANTTNQEIDDLQAEVERLRMELDQSSELLTIAYMSGRNDGKGSQLDDVIRALDCPNDQWALAAIQTAALLDDADARESALLREIGGLRAELNGAMFKVEVISGALGFEGNPDTNDIIVAIGTMARSVESLRQMAIDADHKADRMQVECNRLENQLANQNEAGTKYIDPAREVLADFAMRMLRGEAALVFDGR